MKYDRYNFDIDFVKHRPHIFYLLGYVEKENCAYVICSYSAKTKKLIIKDANNNIPPTHIIEQFIELAENKYLGEQNV